MSDMSNLAGPLIVGATTIYLVDKLDKKKRKQTKSKKKTKR